MTATTRSSQLSTADAEFLAAARLRAARMQPYLAAAVFALVPVPEPGLGTFGVDRLWRVYVDLDVAREWGVEATAAVLLHEAHHVLRDHHGRSDRLHVTAAQHRRWNLAGVASRLKRWPVPSWNSVMRARMCCSQRSAKASPQGVVMSSVPPLKLRIISLTPFTPMVEKWLRSVPR